MTEIEQRHFYRNIGMRLGVLRRYLGKSEAEFAAIAGVRLKSYLAYEHGEHIRPNTNVIMRLADKTGVSIDWLCGGTRCVGRGERNDQRPIFLHRENVRPKLRIVS